MVKGAKKAKKNYKRKTPPKASKAVICYSPNVCPDVMRVTLSYNSRKQAAGGGISAIQDFVFRGNGAFDPDAAAGGQQPLGFDQWSAFYRRYRVIGSKVTIEGVANSAISAGIGIVPIHTNTLYTNRDEAAEAAYEKSVIVGQANSTNYAKLTHSMTTAVMRGAPVNLTRYEEDYNALISANPTKEWYWHTYAYGIGGSGLSFTVDLEVKVEYDIEFYDRQTLVRS